MFTRKPRPAASFTVADAIDHFYTRGLRAGLVTVVLIALPYVHTVPFFG
jgi:hypothetical protein